MTRSQPFFIPDTSPLFAYSACPGCWTGTYGARSDGFDQTFHQTNQSAATVSLNLTASSLQISTGASGCDASVSINGSAFANACDHAGLDGMPAGTHRLQIRPEKEGTTVQFLGVAGTYELDGKTFSNTTLDASSPSFRYSPGWTHLATSGPSAAVSNATLASELADTSRFYNRTLSATTQTGASANLTLTDATAVYIYGMTGPHGGAAEVWLDGEVLRTLNLTNPWKAYSSLLFTSTFDVSETHELSIVNTQQGAELVLDYAVLTRPSGGSTTSSHTVLLVSLIAGISALVLLLGVLLYFFWYNRRRPSPSHSRRHFLYSPDSPSKSGSGSDKWRRLSSSPITPPTGGGIWSGPHADIEQLQVLGRTGRGREGDKKAMRVMASPSTTTTTDYVDYLPYTGPVEARPPHTAEPPLIAGANSLAKGWLEARREVDAQGSGLESASSGGTFNRVVGTRVERPPPLHVRDNRGMRGVMPDLVSEGSYSALGPSSSTPSRREIGSPFSETSTATTPTSALSLAETITAQAVGATRSVARLLAARNAAATAPSAYSQPSSTASHDPSSYSSFGDRSLPKLTTSNLAYDDAHLAYRSPASESQKDTVLSSTSSALRRGVSIKSVKTMRSFFSALVHHPASVPATPALPQAAARPDSGVFPTRTIVPVPAYAPERAEEHGASLGDTDEGPNNMFIELDPNSPVTAWTPSRPGSMGTSLGGRGWPGTSA